MSTTMKLFDFIIVPESPNHHLIIKNQKQN